jgi:hypothetical protein
MNEWSPPVDTGNISKAYGDNTNHYTVTSYKKICDKGVSKMVANGLLLKVARGNADAIIIPFKAVVKNS